MRNAAFAASTSDFRGDLGSTSGADSGSGVGDGNGLGLGVKFSETLGDAADALRALGLASIN